MTKQDNFKDNLQELMDYYGYTGVTGKIKIQFKFFKSFNVDRSIFYNRINN